MHFARLSVMILSLSLIMATLLLACISGTGPGQGMQGPEIRINN
jgi:hypothetical protein